MSGFREYRQRANLSQMQLAENLNVTQACISRWENSTSYPELETAKRISAQLHISLDAIYDNPSQVGPWEIPIYERLTSKGAKVIVSKNKYCLFMSIHEMQALLPWENSQGPRPNVGPDNFFGFLSSQTNLKPVIRPDSVNVIFRCEHIYDGQIHLVSLRGADCVLARIYKTAKNIMVQTDIEKGEYSIFKEDDMKKGNLKIFGVVIQTRNNLF